MECFFNLQPNTQVSYYFTSITNNHNHLSSNTSSTHPHFYFVTTSHILKPHSFLHNFDHTNTRIILLFPYCISQLPVQTLRSWLGRMGSWLSFSYDKHIFDHEPFKCVFPFNSPDLLWFTNLTSNWKAIEYFDNMWFVWGVVMVSVNIGSALFIFYNVHRL